MLYVHTQYASDSDSDSIYFLDKTPRYYLILKELEQVFPDAKFIFLFRNPVQIYASMLSTWGKDTFKVFFKYRFYADIIGFSNFPVGMPERQAAKYLQFSGRQKIQG